MSASVNTDLSAQEPDISSSSLNQRKLQPSTTSSESTARSSDPGKTSAGAPSASITQITPGISPIAEQETPADAIQPLSQQPVSPESLPTTSTENSLRASDLSANNTKPAGTQAQSFDITDRESTLQQAMETMNISILMYAETPSDRLVFINGRKYVEGDYVDGSFFLETITPDGVVLSYEGVQAVLKPKTD